MLCRRVVFVSNRVKRVGWVSFSTRSLPTGLQPDQVSVETSDAPLGTNGFSLNFFDANSGKQISPWHDISLFSETKGQGYYNFLNEIPRYTKPKMEVATKEKFNPIIQDTKKGKLRDYHGPLYWNYGCLTQTWEDPTVQNAEVENCNGDNDANGDDGTNGDDGAKYHHWRQLKGEFFSFFFFGEAGTRP